MFASTWFDLVIGLDFHMVAIPAPPSPVPVPTLVPMPFIGIVFDPAGLMVGSAISMAIGGGPGLVLINGLPATNCGTAVTNLLTLPHTPAPGVTFVPPAGPSNDAELFFGSSGVFIGGSLGVRLGDTALSCSDPVRLPTSMVLAVPKGAPVLNLRPMVPDAAAVASAAAVHGAMKALGPAVKTGGKLFRNLRQVQKRSGNWGRISQGLRKAVDNIAPQRYRDRLKRAVCFLTGHPVDVATGRVLTDHIDFELPGPLPLVFERVYSSSLSWRDGPLGFGWSHSLDQAVWVDDGKVVYLAEDGREIEFLLDDLPDLIIHPGDRVYDPTNRLTVHALGGYRWEIETHDGITHEFAPVPGADPKRAKLRSKKNRHGHAIKLFYDTHGRLESVRDCGGRAILFKHNAGGRLCEIKFPQPHEDGWARHVAFTYSDDSDLVQVTDAMGHVFRFEYVGHLLVKETDRTGLSFYFQYDSTGSYAQCIRTWGDGGIYDHEISYDRRNRKTFVEDSLGRTTIYTMDELGMVAKVTDPRGHSTVYAYDPESGQLMSETGPLGATILRAFDARGNCVSVTGPDGAAVAIEYNDVNLPVRAVDAIGGVWRWGYDATGQLLEKETPAGQVTRYGYARGLLAWTQGPGGEHTVFEHDEQKNLVRVVAPNGGETVHTHDSLGRVTQIKDPLDGVTRFHHDALHRVVRVDLPLGLMRKMAYDAEGNLIEAESATRHVRFRYGGYHKLAEREEAGLTILWERDTEDQVTAIVNEAGERYTFKLDPCGDAIEETGFDGQARRIQRDPEGRVIQVRHPSGRTSRTKYDPAGRLLRVDHSDKTFAAFAYRADGALISAANENGTVAFERDAMGQVVRETTGGVSIESEYNASDHRIRRKTSLGHETRYDIDPMGDIVAITFGIDPRFGDFSPESLRMSESKVRAPWRATFQRDTLGNETARQLPAGIVSRWERDALGRPMVHRVFRDSMARPATGYQWQGEDQIARLTDTHDGPTHFFHDARSFLVGARLPDGQVQHRAVDAVGNLFRREDRSDRQYGPGGRLQEADGVKYIHDADGQLIEKRLPDGQQWKYKWNGHGQLVAVTRPDRKMVAFTYDALDRRIRKMFDGRTTHYVWDGCDLVHEMTDIEGQPLITWELAPGTFAPLAKVEGDPLCGTRYAVVTDHLGAPKALFHNSGEVAWEGMLDLLGSAQIRAEQTACPWRWPGQYEDEETGLYYNRFRYYDPHRGDYINPDPIGLAGGLALYAYVHDPLLWIDPGGLTPFRGTGADWQNVYGREYEFGKHDVDWRSSKEQKTFQEALEEGFRRTGEPRSSFQPKKWAPDAHGKTWPVEWRSERKAVVNIDVGHLDKGPTVPHIGWKSSAKGGPRGHIFVDAVPYNRPPKCK